MNTAPYVATDLAYVATDLAYVATDLQVCRIRPASHVATPLPHVATDLPHVATDLSHVATDLAHVATDLQVCRIRPASSNPSPRAFTLVELLVVIGIIGLLAAIITPVVMQSLTKARNAAIKAEIDMLHMAIMNYKNEYGSFPPCISTTGTNDPAARHILRAFPRTASLASEVLAPVTPFNSIGGWLGGYSDDPTRPVSAGNRRKLYDFDRSRMDNSGMYYFPSGKPGSPYVYIRSGAYGTFSPSGAITGSTPYVLSSGTYTVGGATYPLQSGTYFAQIQVLPSGSTQFFNPDSFQILCAGRDEDFGNDDDLSNFWPGTRREYLDSLKD